MGTVIHDRNPNNVISSKCTIDCIDFRMTDKYCSCFGRTERKILRLMGCWFPANVKTSLGTSKVDNRLRSLVENIPSCFTMGDVVGDGSASDNDDVASARTTLAFVTTAMLGPQQQQAPTTTTATSLIKRYRQWMRTATWLHRKRGNVGTTSIVDVMIALMMIVSVLSLGCWCCVESGRVSLVQSVTRMKGEIDILLKYKRYYSDIMY